MFCSLLYPGATVSTGVLKNGEGKTGVSLELRGQVGSAPSSLYSRTCTEPLAQVRSSPCSLHALPPGRARSAWSSEVSSGPATPTACSSLSSGSHGRQGVVEEAWLDQGWNDCSGLSFPGGPRHSGRSS